MYLALLLPLFLLDQVFGVRLGLVLVGERLGLRLPLRTDAPVAHGVGVALDLDLPELVRFPAFELEAPHDGSYGFVPPAYLKIGGSGREGYRWTSVLLTLLFLVLLE